MPQFTTPASGGTSETGDMGSGASSGPGPGQPQQQYAMAGEITLSSQETAALTALHFGAGSKDKRGALERARRESGLTHQQVLRLQARANRARSNGMTLKGQNFVLKPTVLPKPGAPDVPGLLRDDHPNAKAAARGSDKTKVSKDDQADAENPPQPQAKSETPGVMRRSYAGRKVADAAPAKKKPAA